MKWITNCIRIFDHQSLFHLENSSVGGINRAGTLNSLQSRFELPGPFAAHSLGFPVIMFGFRMKSFFIKWRLKARRDEVRRQNEFFEKLLADASPTSYEDRKLFLSTSRTNNATSEQQDTNMIGMFPNSDTCLPVLWSVLEWFRAWTGRAFLATSVWNTGAGSKWSLIESWQKIIKFQKFLPAAFTDTAGTKFS